MTAPEFSKKFVILRQATPIKRQELFDVFLGENDDGTIDSSRLGEVCIPYDYLDYREKYGVSSLEVTEGESGIKITFAESIMMANFLDSFGESFPSAFLIAQTDKSDFHAYTRGSQGIGLYLLSRGQLEPKGVYLAPSFTAFYIEGQGVEKLMEELHREY